MSTRYPADWDTRRRRVYRRDDYTCANCGVKGGGDHDAESVELHAHHIVPISKGGSHEVSNLKTLCRRCHNAIHRKNVYAATDTGPVSGREGGDSMTRFQYYFAVGATGLLLLPFIAYSLLLGDFGLAFLLLVAFIVAVAVL